MRRIVLAAVMLAGGCGRVEPVPVAEAKPVRVNEAAPVVGQGVIVYDAKSTAIVGWKGKPGHEPTTPAFPTLGDRASWLGETRVGKDEMVRVKMLDGPEKGEVLFLPPENVHLAPK